MCLTLRPSGLLLHLILSCLILLIAVAAKKPQSHPPICFSDTEVNPCQCSADKKQLLCPSINQTLLTIDRNSIKCNSNDSQIYELLQPKFFEHVRKDLILQNCPLPAAADFKNLLERLNLERVSYFGLHSPTNHTLTRDHLKPLRALRALLIDKLPQLQEELLSEVTHIKSLKLLSLQQIPANLLQAHEQLEQLQLIDLQMLELPLGLLQKKPNLQLLTINSPQLTTLTQEQLGDVGSNLRVFKLQASALSILPANLLEQLTGLRELVIELNSLQMLPATFLKEQQELNKFSLKVKTGEVQEMPKDFFKSLHKLKELTLQLGLKTLPPNAFADMQQLKKLDLSHNQLKELPQNLQLFQNLLHDLNLEHNALAELPENFFEGAHKLETLKLSFNNLKQLPSLAPLNKLKRLYASQNQLSDSTLSACLHLANLHIIDLSQNNISSWNFGEMQQNKLQLNISHNQLQQIIVSARSGKQRRLRQLVLDVSHNKLTHFNADIPAQIQHDGSEFTFALADNPWLCDCQNKPLLELLDKEPEAFLLLEQVHCSRAKNVGTEQVELKQLLQLC